MGKKKGKGRSGQPLGAQNPPAKREANEAKAGAVGEAVAPPSEQHKSAGERPRHAALEPKPVQPVPQKPVQELTRAWPRPQVQEKVVTLPASGPKAPQATKPQQRDAEQKNGKQSAAGKTKKGYVTDVVVEGADGPEQPSGPPVVAERGYVLGESSVVPAGPKVIEEHMEKVVESISELSIAAEAETCVAGGGEAATEPENDPDEAWIVTDKDRAIFETLFPEKPKAGDLGRSVQLQVNHFPIIFSRNTKIYMYDVTITPMSQVTDKKPREPVKSKKTCRGIWNEYISRYVHEMAGLIPAYDGHKIAYVVEPGLPDSEKEVIYQEDEDDDVRAFSVVLKRAGKSEDTVINLIDILNYARGKLHCPPLRAIAAVNAYIAHVPAMSLLSIGRRFLYDDYQEDITGAKIARYGFTMTAREGDRPGWTLHLSVNTVAGVFAKAGNAADLAAEIFGCRHPGEIAHRIRDFNSIKRTLQEHFERLKIRMIHNMRKKCVTGVSRKSARDIIFPCVEGSKTRQISVVEYYRHQYNYDVKYPELPCFHIGPIKNNTLIPIELCEILPDQSRIGQLSEKQTTQLLNALTIAPRERFGYIERDVACITRQSAPMLKQIGMEIDASKQYIPGRVIPAPNIEYRQKQMAKPNVGSWRKDKLKFFISPSGAIPWGYAWSVQCGVEERDISHFAKLLTDEARRCGLEMSNPVPVGPIGHPRELSRIPNLQKLGFLVFVLPDSRGNPGGYREDLKRFAETKAYNIGLMTQCVRPQHFIAARGRSPNAFSSMYLGNILLKINTKLGGVNNAPMLEPMVMKYIKDSATLIVGADVTHAPPGSNHPSVAAVLGSVDPLGMRYTAHIRVQDVREEFILDMKSVMRDCLMNYWRRNGKRKPERILFFRDGVGEGAFKKVRSYEIAKIQEACRSLEPGYEPLITFVIVQKRHQTRFMPTDNNCTKSQNVLPGTVVDTHITSPRLFDFYLVSHEGIKGTSKPTHYWVVWDDNRFVQNALQLLTFYLCHCYSRCNRSVSIPAPTYYAHHVATRAKGYIKDRLNSDGMTISSGCTSESCLDLSVLNGAVELHESIGRSMFFV